VADKFSAFAKAGRRSGASTPDRRPHAHRRKCHGVAYDQATRPSIRVVAGTNRLVVHPAIWLVVFLVAALAWTFN
jgi:hypothetical protein